MIRRLRDAFGGGTGGEAMDAAVGCGMAEVLAALDDVVDDDAALGRVYARLGTSVAGAGPGRDAGPAADQGCEPIGVPGAATTTARAHRPAASRRRLALRAAAAAAVALAGVAVAVAAIGMPAAGPGGTDGPDVNSAYVVKHVDSALEAAGPGAIAQMTVTTRGAGGTTTAQMWSYGDQWRSVTYSPTGHLVYDEGSSTASVYTVVSYQARTWARQPGVGRPAAPLHGRRSCGPVVAALPLLFLPGLPTNGPSGSWLPATVARDLREAVSCGALAVAGRQRVDGVEAIELTSSKGSPIPETVWVSPGTYLPVRVVIRPVPGEPGSSQTADITWLAPTIQNLARLTVPVPAGFRLVPLAQAVRPLMQHIPG